MSSDAPGTLPSGTVTFLFTDVEGSTRLWAADKDTLLLSRRARQSTASGMANERELEGQ